MLKPGRLGRRAIPDISAVEGVSSDALAGCSPEVGAICPYFEKEYSSPGFEVSALGFEVSELGFKALN